MECMTQTLSTCFTSFSNCFASTSDCISSTGSSCCSSLYNFGSAAVTSFTAFVTGPLWSSAKSVWDAVSKLFTSGLTWAKTNPGRVVDFSVGCVVALAAAAVSMLCINRFRKAAE